jgi:hypothetical protein
MNIKKIFYFCIVSISGIFGIVYSFFHVDLLITSFLAQLVLIGSIIFLISGLMNLVNTLKERGKKYGTIEYLSFLWFLILLIEISYTNRLSNPDIQGITLPFFILGISLTLGFSIGILYVHFSVKKNKTKEKAQFIS